MRWCRPSSRPPAAAASEEAGTEQAAEKESCVSIGINTAAGEKLTSYAERMERLLDEIDALKDDLKDLKAQIKGDGYNVVALTRLVAIRRNKRRADLEAELLNDLILYAHATGTPLDVAFGGEEAPPPEPARLPEPAEDDA
jgi:uncharacterized protein (UPF0335 family)